MNKITLALISVGLISCYSLYAPPIGGTISAPAGSNSSGGGGTNNVIAGSGLSGSTNGGAITLLVDSTVVRTNGSGQTIFPPENFQSSPTFQGSTDNSKGLQWYAGVTGGAGSAGLFFVINTNIDAPGTATTTADRNTVFLNIGANNSGPGISLASEGTNKINYAGSTGTPIILNGIISTNSDGSTNYSYEYQFASFVATPFITTTVLSNDMPGFATIVQNGGDNFTLATAATIGGVSQNYPDFWTERLVNKVHFTNHRSTLLGTNMPDTMTLDEQDGSTTSGHNSVTMANVVIQTNLVIVGPNNVAYAFVVNGDMLNRATTGKFSMLNGNFGGNLHGTGNNGGGMFISANTQDATNAAELEANGIFLQNNWQKIVPSADDVSTIGTNGSRFHEVWTTRIMGGTVMTANTTSNIVWNTAGYSETIYNTSGSTIVTAFPVLPSTTTIGEVLAYVSAGVITTVSVTGGTIDIGSAVTTLAANGSIAYQADNTTGHFIRLR